jgi:hypothetical protein
MTEVASLEMIPASVCNLLKKKQNPVIAQVVGWEKPDPTTKSSATTKESYTQCHLDVGPALQG